MRNYLFVLLLLTVASPLVAQHEHQQKSQRSDSTMPKKKRMLAPTDTSHGQHQMNTDTGMHGMDVPMSHAFSLHLPMNRNGSGTGWLPDASPMYGYMIHSRKWMYMAHGSIFLRYNDQNFNNSDKRGDTRWDAPTWFMFMGQRQVGRKGLFHFNTMFSLDPLIEGGKGYPLLFQTGETYKGQPLIDRQHPHDLFSELSISYAHAFSRNVDAFIYAGYPGEPALGPVTFMHRPSSLDNPNSPISHHWVDATHITFGVVTAGLRVGKFKLEGSSFTGREPDEERYGFDKPRFDSWSGRLSFNPSRHWALQVSHGYLKSPESIHPDENVNKTTASAIYSIALPNERLFNATALWGRNKATDHGAENAVLAEASLRQRKLAFYGRYEFTEKSAGELVLPSAIDEHDLFNIHALTIGLNYDLVEFKKTRLAAGGQWSIYQSSSELKDFYGDHPMSFQLYLRIYPSLMRMNMRM